MNYEAVVFWSMMIATDVGACDALLRGEPVSPERIDSDWLEYASEFQLIRLDFYAVDLLHRRVELRALLNEAA